MIIAIMQINPKVLSRSASGLHLDLEHKLDREIAG